MHIAWHGTDRGEGDPAKTVCSGVLDPEDSGLGIAHCATLHETVFWILPIWRSRSKVHGAPMANGASGDSGLQMPEAHLTLPAPPDNGRRPTLNTRQERADCCDSFERGPTGLDPCCALGGS